MAKQSGLGDNLYVDNTDVSGDIGAIDTISGGPAVLDVTGINKLAFERIGGLRDGNIEYTAFFNDAVGAAHAALKTTIFTGLITRQVTYCRGTTLGKPAASMISRQLDYAPSRAADGALTIKGPHPATGFGLEWGEQHTAGKRTDGGATNGTGVDSGGASTTFGLQAYLHVFAFTGTSATIKLQESSDNAAGDPYADVVGGAFTVVTGTTQERIATATNLTVERWLRVVTTGTFSNLVFSVNVVRNLTAPAF